MSKRFKPTYVLGVGLSHDGSACLLKDGRVQVAIEKERLTRIKHDGHNDNLSVKYCLEAANISLDEVDLIVQNENFGMLRDGNDYYRGEERIVKDHNRIITISHHLAHAYSALGTCPFVETAVLVVDGCGSPFKDAMDAHPGAVFEAPPPELAHLFFEKDSYYGYQNGSLSAVKKDFSPAVGFTRQNMYPRTTMHSIGGAYTGASSYIFSGMEDAGKLMGLSPYGRPDVYTGEIFDLRDGRVFLNYGWMEEFKQPARGHADFKSRFQYFADIANWMQREIERACLYLVRHRFQCAPHENLVFAGGVALNALANRRILEEGPFKNFYAQPAAGDNGLAIGCAYYGWLEVLKRPRKIHDGNTYFGLAYSPDQVQSAIEKSEDFLLPLPSQRPVTEVAKALSNGKVVAWFLGGSEFGPRALGHRSILADPRTPEIRDHINHQIKLREDFRPFAPSVPLEDAKTYFECDYESPHMLLVAPVRPQWRDQIPSVVHKNNLARLQTVTEKSEPTYFALLREFRRQTGVSVLLNTSLNRRGMPIVETPEEAIDFFLGSEIDLLYLDGKLFAKRDEAYISSLMSRLNYTKVKGHPLLSKNRGMVRIRLSGGNHWTVDFRGDFVQVAAEARESPDTTLTMSNAALKRLFARPDDFDLMQADGDIRVEGAEIGLEALADIIYTS